MSRTSADDSELEVIMIRLVPVLTRLIVVSCHWPMGMESKLTVEGMAIKIPLPLEDGEVDEEHPLMATIDTRKQEMTRMKLIRFIKQVRLMEFSCQSQARYVWFST